MRPSDVLREAMEQWDPDYMDEIIRDLTSQYKQSSMWPGIYALINFYQYVAKAAIALAKKEEV